MSEWKKIVKQGGDKLRKEKELLAQYAARNLRNGALEFERLMKLPKITECTSEVCRNLQIYFKETGKLEKIKCTLSCELSSSRGNLYHDRIFDNPRIHVFISPINEKRHRIIIDIHGKYSKYKYDSVLLNYLKSDPDNYWKYFLEYPNGDAYTLGLDDHYSVSYKVNHTRPTFLFFDEKLIWDEEKSDYKKGSIENKSVEQFIDEITEAVIETVDFLINKY